MRRIEYHDMMSESFHHRMRKIEYDSMIIVWDHLRMIQEHHLQFGRWIHRMMIRELYPRSIIFRFDSVRRG